MNTATLGGRAPGFGSSDMKQILEALQAAAASGGTGIVSVIALSQDPEQNATASGIGQFGSYNGHLYVHCTDAADTNWLDLTVLETLKEEINVVAGSDEASLHQLAQIANSLSTLQAFAGTVESDAQTDLGWSASGGAGNVLPVFDDVHSTRWQRIGGRCFVEYEGKTTGASNAAGTGTLSLQLPRPASASAMPVIVPVGMASRAAGQIALYGKISPTDTNVVLYKLVGSTLSYLTGADLASNPDLLYVFLRFSYEVAVAD